MIEIKNISVKYDTHPVLSELSLDIEKGEILSIVGVNGCGKTTLLKTAVGIISGCGGEIFIDGISKNELKGKSLAKKIAYLPQGQRTPDMSVYRLVLHGRFPHMDYPRRYSKMDKEIAFSAMEKMGIIDLKDKNILELSGGMKQNAYIAMALAQETDYIFLDEPTTYLDVSHQIELMKSLRELKNLGKGVALVMHDLPMAFSFSDKIAVLDGGNIAIKDTPFAVCKSGIVEKLFKVRLTQSPEGKNYTYEY